MNAPLRLLALELGSTESGRGVIEELRQLIPGIWIAGVEKQHEYDRTIFDHVVTTQFDAFLGRYESVNTANLAMTPELSNLVAPFEGKVLNLLGLAAVRPASDYPTPIHGVQTFSDSYDSRKDLFDRHCRFWNYILDHHQINAVVHENLGQEGYDYVALQIARAKKIPTLTFNTSGQLPRVLFVQEDETGVGHLDLGKQIKHNIENELQFENPMFVRRCIKHFSVTPDSGLKANVRNSDYKTNPVMSWLLDRDINLNSSRLTSIARMLLKKINRAIRHPNLSTRNFIRSLSLIKETQRSIREERNCSTNFSPDCPYIYFPLHCQPETSSSIKARDFYRLREAAAFLASELPGDWKLVVKEHPHQLRRLRARDPGFYEQLKSIHRVLLVHSSTPNQPLVDGALAVACVSHSSITAHACAQGKPVISLGDSHFRQAPGYFTVTSSSELRKCISAIHLKDREDNTAGFEQFITQLEASTFEGEFGERFDDVSNEDWARTMAATRHNVSRVIREWLRIRGLAS